MSGVAKKIAGLAGVALLATMTFASASGAETTDTGWLVDGYGHPVEPYVEIPGEMRTGVPATQAGLEGMPERCQAIGHLYDLGLFDGVGSILTENQYKNPTRAWAINPASSQPTKDEKATYPGGPKASAECTSPTSGVSEGTVGPFANEALSLEAASSKTTTTKAPDADLIVSESTNRVTGLKTGDLHIASVLSWLKVEFQPSAEPKVSYRIELGGVNDGKSFSGANYQGLVLAGQGVAGGDLAKQFNEQTKANRDALKAIGRYGLRILEPRVGVSKSGRYVFELSALDGVYSPASRNGQVGQSFGFRLGVSRAAGRYEVHGQPSPHDGYGYLADPSTAVS
jgi:hypothetical protein